MVHCFRHGDAGRHFIVEQATNVVRWLHRRRTYTLVLGCRDRVRCYCESWCCKWQFSSSNRPAGLDRICGRDSGHIQSLNPTSPCPSLLPCRPIRRTEPARIVQVTSNVFAGSIERVTFRRKNKEKIHACVLWPDWDNQQIRLKTKKGRE